MHITHLCNEVQHRSPRISASLAPHDSQNPRREKQSRQAACSADPKAIHLSTRAKPHPGQATSHEWSPGELLLAKVPFHLPIFHFATRNGPMSLFPQSVGRDHRAPNSSLNVVAQEKALYSWHPGREDPVGQPGAFT